MVCKRRLAFSCLLAQCDAVVVFFHPVFNHPVGAPYVDFACGSAFSLIDHELVPADVVVSAFSTQVTSSAVAWSVYEVSGFEVTVDFVGEIMLQGFS